MNYELFKLQNHDYRSRSIDELKLEKGNLIQLVLEIK